MGLTDGCTPLTTSPRTRPLTFDDVELPSGRLSDELWKEQRARFG